jgi:hypothetical protein
MDVYFFDLDDRLRNLDRPWLPSNYKDSRTPWLWVVHSDPISFLAEDDATVCIANGGGILFVSGSPRSGFTENEARDLEAKPEYRNRVHLLRIACPSSQSNLTLENRMVAFLELVRKLKAGDAIPWEKAEPGRWPANLVGIYLILTAVKFSTQDPNEPKHADAIRTAWDSLDTTVRQRIWEGAWDEYNSELSLLESDWKAAGLPLPGDSALSMPELERVDNALKVISSALSIHN